MELKDLQKMVDEKIGIFGGYWKPLEMFAALAEEAGEVGRELNSIYGPKKKRVEIRDGRFALCLGMHCQCRKY